MQGAIDLGSGRPGSSHMETAGGQLERARSTSGIGGGLSQGRGGRWRTAWRVLFLLLLLGLVAWLFGPRVFVGYDLYRAHRALAKPDLAEAQSWLEAAQGRDPDRADVEYLLAGVHRRMVHFQKARTHLERARQLGYPRRDVERQEMMLLFQMGNVDEIGPGLTGLLERGGSDEVAEEVYEAMVLGYYSEFRVIEAEMILNYWLEWRPDSIPARLMRVRIYAARSNSPEMEASLRDILRLDPGHLTTRLMLADYLLFVKRVAEALAECEICRKQAPDDPRVGVELGLCHFQLGQMDTARGEIEGAIDKVNDANLRLQGVITLGQIAAADQQWQLAVDCYKQAVQMRPYDPAATYSYGTALSSLGKNDEGQFQLQRYKVLAEQDSKMTEINDALVKDTNNVDLRIEMGKILVEQGRMSDAAIWMLSALRYDPARLEANEMLAGFYEEAGKVDLAQQYRDAARGGADSSRPSSNGPTSRGPSTKGP
jgi:tetratricopeptide (TPR) repeat protein